VTLLELLGLLRVYWLRCIAGITGGVIAGAVAVAFLPSWYRAVIVVAPAAEITAGAAGLSNLASRFGGLASIAGINLGAPSADRSAITLETLRGQTFLTDFARRRDIVVPLFAGMKYDAALDKWELDASLFDERTRSWKKRGALSGRTEPSDFQIYRRLSKHVYIDEDRRNGMIRVTVESRSPEAAAKWASLLIEDLNEYLRQKDSAEAKRTIGYLEQQVSATQVADMRAIFFRLIEEQTKTLMLAQVREEYALKVVDSPLVPEKPAWPNRVFVVALCAFAGFLIALVSVLIVPQKKRAGR
jgi:hypothetical protein